MGSGARKPMGFLGPTHDESWSAGWHIILLSKAWMESWKRKDPTRSTATVGSTTTTGSRYLNFRYVDTKFMHAIMV